MTITYNTSIVKNGLILNLDAANIKSYSGSGNTWIDLSLAANNAIVRGATFSSESKGYFTFNGTGNHCVVELPAARSVSVFSYNTWVYNSGGILWRTIIDHGNDEWFLGVLENQLAMYDPEIYTGYTLTANNWYNVAATFSSGTPVRLYVNGSLVHQTSNNITKTASVARYGIGAGLSSYTSANEYWRGRISVAQIYNRVLTAEEVQQNFNAFRGRYGI